MWGSRAIGVLLTLAAGGCSAGDDEDGDADGDADADSDAGADADTDTDAGQVDPCCPEGGLCCAAADFGYPADLCVPEGSSCPEACDLCAPEEWCVTPVAGRAVECIDVCPEALRAGDGLCCPAGTRFVEGVGCPLPDLQIDRDYAASTLVFDNERFSEFACELSGDEVCVGDFGDRRLLKFGLRVMNRGNGDAYVGSPVDNPSFIYSDCHMHYHFQGFAEYRLLDAGGQPLAPVGHKQAYCLEDQEPITGPDDGTGRYACGELADQGIQAGWADIYDNERRCQWVDITGIPAGDYIIEATVDYGEVIVESDETNNTARIPVTIAEAVPTSCPNGCTHADHPCCDPDNHCHSENDGVCDCDGTQAWDEIDCGSCVPDPPEREECQPE